MGVCMGVYGCACFYGCVYGWVCLFLWVCLSVCVFVWVGVFMGVGACVGVCLYGCVWWVCLYNGCVDGCVYRCVCVYGCVRLRGRYVFRYIQVHVEPTLSIKVSDYLSCAHCQHWHITYSCESPYYFAKIINIREWYPFVIAVKYDKICIAAWSSPRLLVCLDFRRETH